MCIRVNCESSCICRSFSTASVKEPSDNKENRNSLEKILAYTLEGVDSVESNITVGRVSFFYVGIKA